MSANKPKSSGRKPKAATSASARKTPPKEPRAKKAAKKEKSKAEATPKVMAPKVVRPKGPIPFPMVTVRHGPSMLRREARGFSRGEMTSAGLGTHSALKWGVPVDLRRRSILLENTGKLKSWIQSSNPAESTPSEMASGAKEKEQVPSDSRADEK